MKISTKGRYAVRLMLDVAIHGMDKNVSMRDVAERQNISIKYLEQIVSILTRVGYLKSVRGAQGVTDSQKHRQNTQSEIFCVQQKEHFHPYRVLKMKKILVREFLCVRQ